MKLGGGSCLGLMGSILSSRAYQHWSNEFSLLKSLGYTREGRLLTQDKHSVLS
jgi:hypothetical protein